MKNSILRAALAAALGSVAATAAAQGYGDVARVISASPVYDRVPAPRHECRVEQVDTYEERRTVRPAGDYRPARNEGIGAGTVLGAIVGGVIGHQFGGTSGARDKATGAGAIIGGLIGNSVERDAEAAPRYDRASRDVLVERVPVTRDVQRCEEVPDSRERIVGYDVRYEYNGREFQARMPYDPGPQMPVNVEVRPPVQRPAYGAPVPPRYRSF